MCGFYSKMMLRLLRFDTNQNSYCIRNFFSEMVLQTTVNFAIYGMDHSIDIVLNSRAIGKRCNHRYKKSYWMKSLLCYSTCNCESASALLSRNCITNDQYTVPLDRTRRPPQFLFVSQWMPTELVLH